ncbi:MAG: PepSY domain-containing protein [Lachnospiraceae bacterium]|nr:PepSY domain-containing protein [Lachnospiraceae bacterium]
MKRMKLLSLLALLTLLSLLLAGFSRIDQVLLNTAELSSAAAASGSKDTVKITVDEAKKTAIDDAGAKEKDVTLKKAGLTTDDGIVKYEVEFYYKDFEYEYDIDPNSGKIMDSDKEAMDSEDYAKMKLLQERASDKTSDKSAEKSADKPAEKTSDKSSKENKVYSLTIKDAQKIAYDDAGVKEKDVVLKKAVLTTDDGTDVYEVEFYYKDFEYEYDIDPKTGIITDLDRDPMDAEDRAKMEALKKKGSEKSTDK